MEVTSLLPYIRDTLTHNTFSSQTMLYKQQTFHSDFKNTEKCILQKETE